MPRTKRQDFAGAWHHVMNRGIDHGKVFAADVDCRFFLAELRSACAAHKAQVHAYCLLANHFHLLIHTPEATLSAAMQALSSRFTQSINRRYRRDGPIFRGRYKSVLVETDAQLTHVTRYIHLNPVEAGLVDSAEKWPWSSAAAYVGSAVAPAWLHTDLILAMFGGVDAHAAYAAYLAPERIRGVRSGSDP